ncbi:GFA family protein [Pseudoroseicyclus sp. H15]
MAQSNKIICGCGAVEVEVQGPPILTAACGCDDCQAAGEVLEARPGAPAFRDADGTTPLALYHARKARVVKGEGKLERWRLRKGSPSYRVVTTCCNSFLFLGFDKGPFWISAVMPRLQSPPPLEMRIQTGFLDHPPLSDVPSHRKYSLSMIGRITWAGLAGRFT